MNLSRILIRERASFRLGSNCKRLSTARSDCANLLRSSADESRADPVGQEILEMQQMLLNLRPADVSQAISDKVQISARHGFSATLFDGTTFEALHAQYANHLDLALFTLPLNHCIPIALGHSTKLAFGERLYTIGNPSGLTFTVTSGVYSGERGYRSGPALADGRANQSR